MVEHPHKGSAHPRLSECNSRQPFSQGQDYSNRMVSSSQDFSGDLPNLAWANSRYVCNQNEQQTTSLYISSPRSKCNGSRCIKYLVGGTRQLCLLSNSSHTKNDSKDENLCLPNHCTSPRVAKEELVLGYLIELSTKPPLLLLHWETLLKQPFHQRFHQNVQYLNLHVWHLDLRPNHLKNSQSQWQRELRHLKDFHPEGSMNQAGPILNHGAKRIRWI